MLMMGIMGMLLGHAMDAIAAAMAPQSSSSSYTSYTSVVALALRHGP